MREDDTKNTRAKAAKSRFISGVLFSFRGQSYTFSAKIQHGGTFM
jgi:hypothetical protein